MVMRQLYGIASQLIRSLKGIRLETVLVQRTVMSDFASSWAPARRGVS
jgi:hypothetical protein